MGVQPDPSSAEMRRRAWLAWSVICIFWGGGFLAYRIGVRNAPPLLFAGLRILVAGVLVTGWYHLRGERLPKRSDWGPMALVGLLTEGLVNGVLALSARWLPSGLMAILLAMTPFWMVGIESVLPAGQRLTARIVTGLLLGFGGLVWMVAPQVHGTALNGPAILACVMLQLACFCYAAGSLVARRKPLSVPTAVGAGWQMVAAGGALTLAGTFYGEWSRLRFDLPAFMAFMYLLIPGSVIGFSCYIYALKHLPVSTVALHRYINPVVALILGWIVLREPVTARDAMAIAVMFCGILLVQARRRTAVPVPLVAAEDAG